MPSEYDRKRDFRITSEPAMEVVGEGRGPLRFVIQKHTARRLHWDLRLEWDGVLKSWAVPKGPSLDPKDKRMAVHTEDHPLSYAEFEGVIPEGQYGGGAVILWDEGVYVADEGPGRLFPDRAETERRMRAGLEAGKLSFTLYGKRVKGSFTLVKTSKGEWLLIKHHDGFVSDADLTQFDRSVRSGLTNEELRAGHTPNAEFRWMAGAVQADLPERPLPMLATEAAEAGDRAGWNFEIKLDGIRCLAVKQERNVRLFTRSGRDVARTFPQIAEHLAALPGDSFILDGELVCFAESGVPDFGKMMERFHLQRERDIARQDAANPAVFCIFDLPYRNGWDLSRAAWADRRKALEQFHPASPCLRVVDVFPEHGNLVYEHAVAMGFEGVVGKRDDSHYLFGQRSSAWIKVKKQHSEEFVVGGFTRGQGSRASTFGALLLGRLRPDGKLDFLGSVGTGFADAHLEEIREELGDPVAESPFAGPVDASGEVAYVTPRLWAEVAYGSISSQGLLRFPVFQRLRPDLAPSVPEQRVGLADSVASVLEQLEAMKESGVLEVEGETVRVSNLSKPLWPAADGHPPTTKRDLLRYLARAASLLLPHLADRPLAIVRFPDGFGGNSFFQKHVEAASPEFVEHIHLWSSHNQGARDYLMCNNLPTLLWLGQMAALELHPWYSRARPEPEFMDQPDYATSEETLDASPLNYPDFMVFDLDPQGKAEVKGTFVPDSYRRTVEVALHLKGMLDALGLRGFVKSSGKSGLHIYVPIARSYDYDQVRAMAETFGRHVERALPELVTMEWVVAKRPDKIFFDHNQNVRGKTLASVYSPRAAPGGTISCPVRWEDLEGFGPRSVRVADCDPSSIPASKDWSEMLRLRQRIG